MTIFRKANLKKYYPAAFTVALLATNMALAAGDSDAALEAMANKASSIFEGNLLRIAINGSGLASIVYSIIGGFKPGAFIGGISIIIFYMLFSTFTKTLFG